MHLEGLESGRELQSVGLGLTASEAEDLRGSLSVLLGGDRERHEHVSSSDYQREITLWLNSDQ